MVLLPPATMAPPLLRTEPALTVRSPAARIMPASPVAVCVAVAQAVPPTLPQGAMLSPWTTYYSATNGSGVSA
ncbi:hypothetical protein GO279_04852 [Ralstonia solanacearum]|nr:hypothetical protein [Ralstonia solanacearum]NKA56171.1 hypothetical protein [Ralstonia solanacearum]NKA86335.1 hypothetical protein [Ralstonia solanacearum]NKF57738.1 hypothetical protein [Ralstonia solanacearum]NKF62670.1 hypothetical protein [Ralstonia solanacearum]